jgi:hypothetical protein
MNKSTLEQRVAELERAMVELRGERANGRAPRGDGSWLDHLIGSISDQDAFEEASEYGRAFRTADRPPDDPGESP